MSGGPGAVIALLALCVGFAGLLATGWRALGARLDAEARTRSAEVAALHRRIDETRRDYVRRDDLRDTPATWQADTARLDARLAVLESRSAEIMRVLGRLESRMPASETAPD
jgi:hypothetical protein